MPSNQVELVAKLRDQLTGPLRRQVEGLGQWQRRAIAVGIAAVGMGTALAAATRRFIQFADRVTEAPAAMHDLAQGLGIADSEFASLAYVIQQAGGEAAGLPMMFQRVRVAISEAADEASPAAQALGRIGLSYEDLIASSPDEQLRRVIGGLSTLSGTADQASAAQALLGRGAVGLRGAMNLTAGEIKAAEDAARELGVVMSDEAYAAADEFQDGLATLKARLNSLQVEALAPILPDLIGLMDEFIDFAKAVLPDLIDAAGDVIQIMRGLTEAFGAVQDAIEAVPLAEEQQAFQRNMTGWEHAADALLPALGLGISGLRQGIGALGPVEVATAGDSDVLVGALRRVRDAAVQAQAAAEAAFGEESTIEERYAEALARKKMDTLAAWRDAGTGAGAALAEEDEKALSAYEERLQEIKADDLTAVADQEAARHEALVAEAAERKALMVEQARQEAAAEQAVADARAASIQRGIEWSADFGTSMVMAAYDGQDAWDQFWNGMANRVIELVFSEAFQSLLGLLVGGGGGILGGLFGALFSTGGEVTGHGRRASTGYTVPGTGYGDHVPILAEPGERVLTRDETRAYAAGGRGGRGSVTVNLSMPSMVHTGSQSEMRRAAATLQRILDQGRLR